MSDTSTKPTLAENARRLAAIARAKRESESDSQEQRRLQAQLEKLSVEIGHLRAALRIHNRLASVGAPVPGLPDLAAEPREVRDQVNRAGRPTWRYINARVSRLERVTRELMQADREAWNAWAVDQISTLPVALIPRLGFDRRQTESRLQNLERISSRAPDLAAVDEFQLIWHRVHEDLARIETAGVNAVLSRFVQGRVRLSDLSDDELELLMQDETIRGQLYLSLS